MNNAAEGPSFVHSPQRPSDDLRVDDLNLSSNFHIHHRLHLVNMQLSEETKVRRLCIYHSRDICLTLFQERISRVIEVSRVAVH